MSVDKENIILQFTQNLFWDTNINDLDMDKHKAAIINRVIDYGFMNDWNLIKNYYGLEEIKNITLGLRSMFPESLAFIANITNTPENQFRCYEQLQSKTRHWNF